MAVHELGEAGSCQGPIWEGIDHRAGDQPHRKVRVRVAVGAPVDGACAPGEVLERRLRETRALERA